MLLTEMLSAIISSLIDAAMHVAFYSKQVAVIDLLTDDPRNDLNAGMRLIKDPFINDEQLSHRLNSSTVRQ